MTKQTFRHLESCIGCCFLSWVRVDKLFLSGSSVLLSAEKSPWRFSAKNPLGPFWCARAPANLVVLLFLSGCLGTSSLLACRITSSCTPTEATRSRWVQSEVPPGARKIQGSEDGQYIWLGEDPSGLKLNADLGNTLAIANRHAKWTAVQLSQTHEISSSCQRFTLPGHVMLSPNSYSELHGTTKNRVNVHFLKDCCQAHRIAVTPPVPDWNNPRLCHVIIFNQAPQQYSQHRVLPTLLHFWATLEYLSSHSWYRLAWNILHFRFALNVTLPYLTFCRSSKHLFNSSCLDTVQESSGECVLTILFVECCAH